MLTFHRNVGAEADQDANYRRVSEGHAQREIRWEPWVGVSVLSIEQEKLGASFKKMCERFLSNTTAGVFAMIVAQILHARRLMAAELARAAGEVDNLGLPPPKKDD